MWWVVKFGGEPTGPYSDEQILRGISQRQFTKLNKISSDRQHWKRLDQTEFWNPVSNMPEEMDLPSPPLSPHHLSAPQQVDETDRPPNSPPIPERLQLSEKIASPVPQFQGKRLLMIMGGGVAAALVLLVVVLAIIGVSRKKGTPSHLPDRPAVTNEASGSASAKTNKVATANDFEAIKKRIVLIHTATGSGTGFLVKMAEKKYVMTNDHVVRDSKPPEMVLVDGTKIELGAMSVASDRDLARYEVMYDGDCFEVSDRIPNNNDEIWIYGNSMGDDVITSLRGFVTGVGSKVIKVNAEFVGGNSGSPIVAKDGTVVAVSSYLRNGDEGEDWTTRDTSFDSVRRFGTRFSNVDWVKVDKKNYERCCARLEQLGTYWDYLLPYLVRDDYSDEEYKKLRLRIKGLEHKDVYRKDFGSDEAGFHEMLMALSKAYASQGGSWRKWQKLVRERDDLIKQLGEAIDAKELTLENGRKALKEFDAKNKIEKTWDNVKAKHRDFNAKRKEALLMARDFLTRTEWQNPLMKHGYGDLFRRGSVDWYLALIDKFLDQNVQKLKDLNKALKQLENGDDDDEE